MRCGAIRPINAQFRRLKPHADFEVSKSRFPRLLVELNSTTGKNWSPELIRMLLQGAALVRFANSFLDEFKAKKDFVIIAIFIRDFGTATRYTLCQRNDTQDPVCYAISEQARRLSCRRFVTKQRILILTRQLAVLSSHASCIT
jgi:hypothetical protein